MSEVRALAGEFLGRLYNLLQFIGLQTAFLLPLAKLSEPFKIPIWNLEKNLISRRHVLYFYLIFFVFVLLYSLSNKFSDSSNRIVN